MTSTDLDMYLELVADRQRRCVLQYIRDNPGDTIGIDELVGAVGERMAREKCESTVDQERIVIKLSHVHLPKFADHDIIDHDRDSNTVRYKPNNQIESLLDLLC